jgi:hypothetical protein
MSQTFGARDGFSLSGVALLLTATIGWRALMDRPTASGAAAAAAAPAETAMPTPATAVAEMAALTEPALADTA